MEIPDYLRADIELAADKAYRQFSRAYPIHDVATLHRQPRCFEISALTVANLIELDYPCAKRRIRDSNIGAHAYAVLYDQNDPDASDLIIDPTWQQFASVPRLERGNPPRVLIGEPSEAVEIARQFGVPSRLTDFWLPDHS